MITADGVRRRITQIENAIKELEALEIIDVQKIVEALLVKIQTYKEMLND